MQAPPTPWLVRHRVFVGTMAFLLALFLTSKLNSKWPNTPLDAVLALPVHLRIDGHAAPGPALPLVIPALFIMASWALRAWARSSEGTDGTTSRTGAFTFVRHPRELGVIHLATGFALFLPPPGLLLFLVIAGGTAVTLAMVRGRMEHAADPAEAARYVKSTGAFWPRAWNLRAWRQQVTGAALLAESWHAGVALYLGAMAVGAPWVAFAGLAWACTVALRNAWMRWKAGRVSEDAVARA